MARSLDPQNREAENHRRLRLARNAFGCSKFRLWAVVPIPLTKRKGHYWSFRSPDGASWQWGSLLGQAISIDVPEAVDIWALLADVKRFIAGWRPARMRSDTGRARAAALLEEWERIGRER